MKIIPFDIRIALSDFSVLCLLSVVIFKEFFWIKKSEVRNYRWVEFLHVFVVTNISTFAFSLYRTFSRFLLNFFPSVFIFSLGSYSISVLLVGTLNCLTYILDLKSYYLYPPPQQEKTWEHKLQASSSHLPCFSCLIFSRSLFLTSHHSFSLSLFL